jgi:hypothetical protein
VRATLLASATGWRTPEGGEAGLNEKHREREEHKGEKSTHHTEDRKRREGPLTERHGIGERASIEKAIEAQARESWKGVAPGAIGAQESVERIPDEEEACAIGVELEPATSAREEEERADHWQSEPAEAKEIRERGREGRACKNGREEDADRTQQQGSDHIDQRGLKKLEGRDAAEEEDEAKKREGGGDEQKSIGEAGEQFAGDQRKGRETRAEQEIEGLALFLTVDSGGGKGGGDKDNQEELDLGEQGIEIKADVAQRATAVADGAGGAINREPPQKAHQKDIGDDEPDSALTAQMQAQFFCKQRKKGHRKNEAPVQTASREIAHIYGIIA